MILKDFLIATILDTPALEFSNFQTKEKQELLWFLANGAGKSNNYSKTIQKLSELTNSTNIESSHQLSIHMWYILQRCVVYCPVFDDTTYHTTDAKRICQ